MTAELWKRRAEGNDARGMFQARDEQRRGRRIKVQPSIACNGETHEFKALTRAPRPRPAITITRPTDRVDLLFTGNGGSLLLRCSSGWLPAPLLRSEIQGCGR